MAARMIRRGFRPLSLFLSVLLLFCGCTGGGSLPADAETSPADPMKPLADGQTFPLDLSCTGGENRVILVYSADRALRGTLVLGGGQTLDIWLTAGTRVRTGFLLPAGCGEVSALTLSACKKSDAAQFALQDASLDTQHVTAGVVTISNGRYELGADLDRGGAVTIFRDLQNNGKYGNLVNVYDAGRLIQQSYYGTSEPPYETAIFAGKPCPYNPVQAGDQYTNLSRLVDCEITDSSVYVKCQPLDWPKKNSLTPSYMENTYTLTDTCAKVENRFTDFSGYRNGKHGQEIPAFYTLAALNRFVYADSGWKDGAALTWVDGVGSYYDGNSRAFDLSTGETWGAWADADGYAFGVYTPGITGLVVSRNEPAGKSPSDRNNASSYIGATRNLAVEPYKTYSYAYLLAAGDISFVRNAFSENRDFTQNEDFDWYPGMDGADPAYLTLDFTDPFAQALVWGEHHMDHAFTDEGMQVTCRIDGTPDPYFYLDYDGRLDCSDVRTLVIEYRTGENNSSDASRLQIFGCTGSAHYAAAETASEIYDLIPDGAWHTLKIPLHVYAFWKGALNAIRFDVFTSAASGDTITLRSVTLN